MHLRQNACRNYPKKLIPNRFKMVSGRCLGDARGLPRASPGTFRGLIRGSFQTQLQIYAKFKDSGRLPGRPGSPPGPQRNPKNQLKVEFLLKKGVPIATFCRFSCTTPVFTIFARFSIDFSRKIDDKSMKKQCICSFWRLFFSTCRPSRNIVFYDTKATSSFFALLQFF